MPGLSLALQTRLIYGVNLRLEAQVLDGTGVGENLLGILRTNGIGAPASGAPDSTNTDLVLNGITSVINAGAVPTGVVWNPIDHAKAMKAKATDSGVRLDSSGAFSVEVGDQVWNVPSVLNAGMPPGTALVGDFFLGCTLFVREGVNVRASDSDQDDFLRNKVTLLGEGRFGLAVWQPTAFAKVTLGFAA